MRMTLTSFVYRTKRRRGGKVVQSRLYRARLRFPGETKVRDISLGVTDRQVANQRLQSLIQEHERGLVGFASASQRAAFDGALDMLVQEYVADLKALGRSTDHVRHVDRRLWRLMRECGWRSLRETTSDSFLRWRSKQKQSPKTLNEYLAALSALCSWLRKQDRLTANPFERVSKVDTRGKQRFQRRALNDKEACALLTVSEPRSTIYLLALHTGLRRGEINATRRDDLKLDGDRPWIRIRAGVNKNRKEQRLPLHPELVAKLQAMKLTDLSATAPVFPEGVPPMKVVRADLQAVGIPLRDDRGHRVDFHALRTTFITRLQLAGVPPREVQELARHSDMRLSTKNYMDVSQLPLAATVRQMPALGATPRSDTPTDTHKPVGASQNVSPAVHVATINYHPQSTANIGEMHCESLAVTAGQPKSEWRREGDSNPRWGLAHSRFPGVCVKPLCHLSIRRRRM